MEKTTNLPSFLPKEVVEACTVPYQAITMPFKHTIYRSLSVKRRQIRLLEIPYSLDLNTMACNLITMSLDDELEYAILSYEFGTIGQLDHLTLSGHRFSAPKSVVSAIRQFINVANSYGYRGYARAIRIWISSICINQASDAEKTVQDQLMPEITAKAKITWDLPEYVEGEVSNGITTAIPAPISKSTSNDETPVKTRVGTLRTKLTWDLPGGIDAFAQGIGMSDATLTVTVRPVLPDGDRDKPSALTSTGNHRILTNANKKPLPLHMLPATFRPPTSYRMQPCKLCHDLCLDRRLDGSKMDVKAGLTDLQRSADQGCPSCALLRDGISLCEPDFLSSETSFERVPKVLDGYYTLQRNGYSVFAMGSMGDALPAPFKVHKKFINGACDRGCGLCLTFIYQNGPRDVMGTAVELDFFVERGSAKTCPWRSIRAATPISGDTSSEQSFSRAVAWLQQCHQDHEVCGGPRIGPLPDRVLDIGTGHFRDIGTVRLYETKNELVKYVSLSHCWGDAQHLTTQSSTIEDRKSGIFWDTLPRTFQDAIAFTRRLNIQYLWIDSLCIIQDDKQDWEQQSAKMCSIYENSYVTLSATKAASSAEGCFSQASQSYRTRELNAIDKNGISHKIFVRRHLPHWLRPDPRYRLSDRTQDLPILDRAWVMQERFLPPRVLHFGRHELMWECMQGAACECSFLDHVNTEYHQKAMHHEGISRPGEWGLQRQDQDREYQENLTKRWRALVAEYSRLMLTKESDIFPALSGLAKQLNREKKDVYIAGLWKTTLAMDLLWESNKPENPTDNWRAPTWSWASVKGPVHYVANLVNGDESPQYLQILEACQIPVGVDDTGEISSAFLRVSAQLCPGVLTIYKSGAQADLFIDGKCVKQPIPDHSIGLSAVEFEIKLDSLFPHTTDRKDLWDNSAELDGREVFCMRVAALSNYEYSLLIWFDPSQNAYERIGIVADYLRDQGQGRTGLLPWNDSTKCFTSVIRIV